MSGSNVKQAVPFFMVKNIQLSIDFYTNGLGFTIANSWTDHGKLKWCWLQKNAAAIMLQEIHEKSRLYEEELGKGVEIYFICENALTIYSQITSNGISTAEPFVGNNMWVVSLKDPDGYKISFESVTDVPQETKYSAWKA